MPCGDLTVIFISEAVAWMYDPDPDECYNRDGSITNCNLLQDVMMWLENYHDAKNLNTRLSIHEQIGILELKHPNEVNIYQYECPKNGRLKQYWL
jgi:hypothetical protein